MSQFPAGKHSCHYRPYGGLMSVKLVMHERVCCLSVPDLPLEGLRLAAALSTSLPVLSQRR